MQKNAKTTSEVKDLRLEVKNQLTQTLSYLKELWGEKKFNNKVDEAAKLFTKGLKKEETPKETVKKDKKAPAKAKAASDKKEDKKAKKVVPEVIADVTPASKKQAPKKNAKKSLASATK